jgi:L-alanine-DL-glutamate epimerase-like enolase superfamily enzyme
MKISKIEASAHRFPLEFPLLDGIQGHRSVLFCRIETDTGLVGWGITGHFLLPALIAAINTDFRDLLLGMDPRDTEAIHHTVWKKLNPRAMSGVISNALSAIDIACWDIHGKETGRTVTQLMGGFRDYADTYVTFGNLKYDDDGLVECAKMHVEQGVTRLKMEVAYKMDWRRDVKRVRAVRDAIGPDVELMIDANYKFSPPEARYLCREVEECNLAFFEEPLLQNDARQLADLRRSTSIPLAAGQMEGHLWRFREFIEHQAVDYLQPNVLYNGGYTETRKIGHMAQAYNITIENGGGWPIYNMHTMAGLMNGGWVECHAGTTHIAKLAFKDAPTYENNQIKIPDTPGLGFKPNLDALAEYKIDPN